MKLLAIDSSGLVASVAVQVDDILVGEYTIHNKKTHSQTLLPMIADMLDMAEIDKRDLDAIAVASGPGSFTGLRIGAATAKGLAQALDIPIVPVSTLMGLAFNLNGCDALVCPIMDARRSQAYSCVYNVQDVIPVPLCDEAAEPIETIISRSKEWNREVIFLGDGVPVFRDRIVDELERARFASDAVRYQRAASISALGRILFEKGESVPAEEFAPVYLRKSQAEREAQAGE